MTSPWVGSVTAALAGLVLLGTAGADWLVATGERDVGGVAVPTATAVAGGELSSLLVVVGLAAVGLALPLAVARGVVRRALAALVVGLAGLGLVATALGVVAAAARPGRLQPVVVVVAVVACAALGGAGLVTLRSRGSTRLPARYDAPAGPQPSAHPDADPAGAGTSPRSGGVPEPTSEWEMAADEEG